MLFPGRSVELLLSQGARPDFVGVKGVAAIHLAAGKETEKNTRCLKMLLQHGADPNIRYGHKILSPCVSVSFITICTIETTALKLVKKMPVHLLNKCCILGNFPNTKWIRYKPAMKNA